MTYKILIYTGMPHKVWKKACIFHSKEKALKGWEFIKSVNPKSQYRLMEGGAIIKKIN